MEHLQNEESALISAQYGKYALPPTLQQLLQISNELEDSQVFYSGLGFYVTVEPFRYFNTPCDVIVFGNTGMDGIHYGFLTDYGQVESLEEATIVCVSPMDFDSPVRIAAANIRDFLSIDPADSALFFNNFRSESHYVDTKRGWEEEAANSPYQQSAEKLQEQAKVRSLVRERLSLTTISQPYAYIQDVIQQRKERITIPTQDGLGVIESLGHQGNSATKNQLPVDSGISFVRSDATIMYVHKDEALDLEVLAHYLQASPRPVQLALIRDIQMNFVLEEWADLQKLVTSRLQALGQSDEVRRIGS